MCYRLRVILAALLCCAAFPLMAQETENPPAYVPPPVEDSPSSGWSCSEFPCEDDREAFLQRIRVPEGFALEHVGRFPGLVQQIAYGVDGRLHATVLEDGSAYGAVYTLQEDGHTTRYPAFFLAPIGLAVHPKTGELFVSARVSESAGGIWRLREELSPQVIRSDLPCCMEFPGNQPNGMVFDASGVLYIGIGARSDYGETGEDLLPEEASLLRLDVATGQSEVIARGLRNPFDVVLSSTGQLYVTDQGTLRGQGDRVLSIEEGAHYGWPYWRWRGCVVCPPLPPELTIADDWLILPEYSAPRGIAVYEGEQFPHNFLGSVFVTLWLNAAEGQRILWLDPAAETFETFVSGLMRPTDVVIAPDGTLVFADSVYGDIWRVRYVRVD